MNTLEHQLLLAETGGAKPRLCVRSGTLVDTGRWWRRSPVWLCVTGDELILLAVARRRFFARIPLRAAHASRYHHASGELVIEPGADLPLQRIRLPAADALRVLGLLHPAVESGKQPAQGTS